MTVLNDFGEPSQPFDRTDDDGWQGWVRQNIVPFAQQTLAPLLESNPSILNDDGSMNWLQFGKSLAIERFSPMQPLEDLGMVYDGAIDVVNTVGGSTIAMAYGYTTAAVARDWSASSNPYFRDGLISWSEINEMYNPFENDVTIGQQVTTGTSRMIYNYGLEGARLIGGDDLANQINEGIQQYVDQENRKALEDPDNTQKLGSWQQIFDYNFNQYDKWQRDSAFETMGPMKFLSGGLDFAWQAYAAPEVVLAKGFSAYKYARSTMKFTTPEGRATARRELVEHNIYRMSGGTVGRVTDTGLLAESLARMSPRQVRKHDLAIRSNNPEMVANVLGQIDDPRAVGDALLALSGDRAAMQAFHLKYPALADKIRYQREQVDELKSEIDNAQQALDDWADDASGIDNVLAPDVGPDNLKYAFRHWVKNQAAIKATAVRNSIELNSGEVKTLESVIEEGMRDLPGLRSAATVDSAVLRDVALKGSFNIANAEAKAMRRAARQVGDFSEYAFRVPGGRTIRVIRSMADKVTTKRANGMFPVTDDAEFYAELDATLNNNRSYRKAALAPEGSDERMITIYEMVETEAGRFVETSRKVDAVQFRKEMMNKALSLTPGEGKGKSLGALRWEFVRDLEKVMFFDMLDRYGVSRLRALEVFENFKYMRNKVAEQIKERGWVKDDKEIVLTPDLQSKISETYIMLDFDFMETVLRLQNSGLSKQALQGGRRGFNEIARVFDMFWRPLALMRLGYTQRNLAEGWIRTLAAYGSIADLSTISDGTGNFLSNMGARFATVKNGVTNIATGKKTVRRLRSEMSNDIGFMKAQDEIVRGLDDEVSGYDARIERIRAAATNRLMGVLRSEVDTEFRAGESVVWDDVTADASARIGEDWLDYADEFWVDPGSVTKLAGVGFADLFDATQVGVRRSGGTPLLADSPKPLLSPQQTRRLNQIATQEGDVVRLKDTKNFEEYKALWVEGSVRRAQREVDEGGVLVAWNQDGTYSRIRDIRQVFETAARGLTLEGDAVVMDTRLDGALANLAVLPMGTQVKAVRSTVYGKTLDLRNQQQDIWEEFTNWVRKSARKKDLTGASGKRLNADGRNVRELHSLLLGTKTKGKGVADVTWQQVKELREILSLMDEDPDFARAIFAKIYASSLPKHVRDALESEGLIVPSTAISRALSNRLGGLRNAKGRVEDDIENIRQTVWDETVYLNSGLYQDGVFQGGTRVEDDILNPDVQLTPDSMNNWAGPGMYTTKSGGVAGGYLVGERNTHVVEGMGKAIRAAIDNGSEPVLYQAPPPIKQAFIDLDQKVSYMDPYAEADELVPTEVLRRIEQQNDLLADVFAAADEIAGSPIDAGIDEVYEAMAYSGLNRQFPMTVYSGADDASGETMRDFMFAIQDVLTSKGLTEEQAWNAWINAVKGNGYDGIRHVGGSQFGYDPHDVFIWYEMPEISRLDEVSDLGLEALRLTQRWLDYEDEITRVLGLRSNAEAMKALDITGIRNIYGSDTPIPEAVGMVDFIGAERLAKVARDLGYGKVLVDSPTTVEGYTTTYLHDMVSANRGSADVVSRAVPDYLYESFTANTNAFGETVQRPLLDLANTPENIMIPEPDRIIMDKARNAADAGASRFSQPERTRLIQMMEESGNTHVSIMHPNGRVSYLTKSQLMKSRKVADEFLSMTRGDEVKARVEQILAKDDAYVDLQAKRTEASQQLTEATSKLAEIRGRVAAAADEIGKRSKKTSKKRIGQGFQNYRGNVYADAFNEQYQGAYMMNQSSGAQTNARDIVGYTDDQTKSMRRTSDTKSMSSASDVYWQELEILANRQVRNDMVARRMLEGQSDEEIIEWLKSDTKETRAILRDSFPYKPLEGRLVPDFEAGLAQRRQILDDYFPDADVRKIMAEGEVQTADLIKYQAWRDMPDYEGNVWENVDNKWTRFTSKVMHVLGTVPEDTLVRHPFYRNRFNDEMRRQIDMFNGDTIGPEEMSALRRASHQYALKSTRETLYTVTRLSTPAYALRFIVPFFPAWESSMKFWSKTFIEKPVTLVRFAQLMNAPYAAGWVVDDDGNPIKEDRRHLQSLFSSGKGSIIVPWFGSKENGGNIGSFRIPLASLNVVLPGDYPWMPTADPLLQIPLSYIATHQPTKTQALQDFEAFGIPVGDVVVRSTLPFGKPYDEKDFLDVASEAALPAAAKRLFQSIRGEASAEYLGVADEIYRTKLTNWELDGRQGKAPSYEEALQDANEMLRFRAVASLVMPFSTTPQSPYQFYIEESRRLDDFFRGQPDALEKADNMFLSLYGREFFRYRKSLSGSRGAGVASTATAMTVYEDNKKLGGRLARIGEQGELLQMMTNGFATGGVEDEYSEIIRAAQTGMSIPGAQGRFLRGGPSTATILTGSPAEDAAQTSLGWKDFEDINNQINAALGDLGLTNINQAPELAAVKSQAVEELRNSNPAWARDYDKRDSGTYSERFWAIQLMLEDKNFMSKYGSAPHIQGLIQYMSIRQEFVSALAEIDANGGSDDINAVSNAPLLMLWQEQMASLTSAEMDPTWVAYYNRWLRNDPLDPIPAMPSNLTGGE